MTYVSPKLDSAGAEQKTPGGPAGAPGPLVGAWSLVSFSIISGNGDTLSHPMGQQPNGLLVYTADGCMSAHLLDPERHSRNVDARASADPTGLVDVEAVTSVNPYVGYGGTYEFRGSLVVHHVRVSSVPQWIATQQVRHLRLDGNVLTLRSPAMDTGELERTPCLVWRRLSGPA